MGKGDIYMNMYLHTKHELAHSYYIIVRWTNTHIHMLNKIKQGNTHSNISSTELYTQILISLKAM